MNPMTATNNTNTFAQSTASAQSATGSIVLLATMIAFVRAALVVVGAVSLGAAARFFFPEMLAIPSSPMLLLAVVAIDTFAVVAGVLFARSKSGVAAAAH